LAKVSLSLVPEELPSLGRPSLASRVHVGLVIKNIRVETEEIYPDFEVLD